MRSYCLHCRCAHGAHEEREDAFTVAAGTPHVGGLWDCPLVYSTSIALSQRATVQASKCRVSEYCTASVHKERRALLRYGCSVLGTSSAKSLMLGIVGASGFDRICNSSCKSFALVGPTEKYSIGPSDRSDLCEHAMSLSISTGHPGRLGG